MDLCYELFFLQDFAVDYLRNNRTNGGKNLRCFPSCADKGHTNNGFCGQMLKARLSITSALSSAPLKIDHMLVVGEFQPIDENYAPVSSGVLRADILKRTEGAFPSCVLASVVVLPALRTPSRTVLEVSFECRPWNYSWCGSRQKQHTKHAFVVSVLAPIGGGASDQLRVLSQHCSPGFRVSCVRRSGTKGPSSREPDLEPEPEPEAAGPSSSASVTGAGAEALRPRGATAVKRKPRAEARKKKKTRRRPGSSDEDEDDLDYSAHSSETEEHIVTRPPTSPLRPPAPWLSPTRSPAPARTRSLLLPIMLPRASSADSADLEDEGYIPPQSSRLQNALNAVLFAQRPST